MAHPRLSGEEIERLGQELYEQKIRAKVEPGNEGKICMIDVETTNACDRSVTPDADTRRGTLPPPWYQQPCPVAA